MSITITSSLEELVDDKKGNLILKSTKKKAREIKPIGLPVLIGFYNGDDEAIANVESDQEVAELIYIDFHTPKGANAYAKGSSDELCGDSEDIGGHHCYPVQYYHINR